MEKAVGNPRILIGGDSRLKFKGVKEALTATSMLKIDNPGIQIVRLNPYDNLVHEKEWADIDEYHYHLPPEEVAKLYRTCDILVFVPYREGFGLPALEAMACGIPAVLSNIPSLREISNNGETGMLVNIDVNEIAAAAKRLLTDGPLRRILRARGLMRAQDFNYHGLISKLCILFDYLKEYKCAEREEA
jgi:glycosyltransferase involved in cell wall biosynthesis